MAKTKDALKILERVTGADAQLRELIKEETWGAHVARLIYQARTEAGLTQQQLAELVGTKQPDIARLEDADLSRPLPHHAPSNRDRVESAAGNCVRPCW